jgi:hypothetical protein
MNTIKHNQSGFIVSLVAFFVMLILLTLGLSMTLVIYNRQKAETGTVNSTQAYYAAESGIEDALLSLKANSSLVTNYNLAVNGATTNINIPAIDSNGNINILSTGILNTNTRKIQVVYGTDATHISVHDGLQAGSGGVTFNGGSLVGNLFSNGPVSSPNLFSIGTINGDIVIAGQNSLTNVQVGTLSNDNVYAYSCILLVALIIVVALILHF